MWTVIFLLNFFISLYQLIKHLIESVNLCKFMTRCPDVLADKPHPRFLRESLSSFKDNFFKLCNSNGSINRLTISQQLNRIISMLCY